MSSTIESGFKKSKIIIGLSTLQIIGVLWYVFGLIGVQDFLYSFSFQDSGSGIDSVIPFFISVTPILILVVSLITLFTQKKRLYHVTFTVGLILSILTTVFAWLAIGLAAAFSNG